MPARDEAGFWIRRRLVGERGEAGASETHVIKVQEDATVAQKLTDLAIKLPQPLGGVGQADAVAVCKR